MIHLPPSLNLSPSCFIHLANTIVCLTNSPTVYIIPQELIELKHENEAPNRETTETGEDTFGLIIVVCLCDNVWPITVRHWANGADITNERRGRRRLKKKRLPDTFCMSSELGSCVRLHFVVPAFANICVWMDDNLEQI